MLSNLVSQIDAESTADEADYTAFLSWSRSLARAAEVRCALTSVIFLLRTDVLLYRWCF